MAAILSKYNFIYLLALASLIVCLPFIKEKLNNTTEFFGIAENQIRNINLEYDVEILKIYKLQGAAVKIGDTLLNLRRVDLEIKIQNLTFDKLQIEKKILSDQEAFLSAQKLYESNKQEIIKNYQLKYAEIERNAKLQNDIVAQVLSPKELSARINPSIYLLNDLKEKETLALNEIELKIKNSKNENSTLFAENQVKRNKLIGEIELLSKANKSFALICPEDGIIGQLELNPGDKIQAYNAFIKIYDTHPNTVTIYIGDNQLSSLKLGDSVFIHSINTKNYALAGYVNALGTRITPLPERLKKIPDLRAWGREVQIRIPAQNELMQGEKVLVRIQRT